MKQLTAWPERVLVQQENWIGKSHGAEVDFPVEGAEAIRVFTTRIDTIWGATFMVLAPEHPMVDGLLAGQPDAPAKKEAIGRLRGQDRRARLEGRVEKEGVFTGRYATNPFTRERIPVWVGNFVLMGYGTGAIMSVPAHDERDFEFARKYGLDVRVVVQPEGEALDGKTMREAYTGSGRVVNSGPFDGMTAADAIPKMAAWAQGKGIGKATTTYRLKDWLISRQRYWGTPIPVVYCEKDGVQPVPDDQLPVVLPKDAPFTGEGGNPLEKVPGFVNATCPRCGGRARRETDTMDTFVDSSWYFYRYVSPKKDDSPFDVAAVAYWFPIDLYVGGIEHAILHLVYSRFWTKVMRDLGLVALDEPVVRLFPQGMVHRDGEVMSKSKGNTIAPDDVIARYGADTLRLYILFAAPPELAMEWSETGIEGPHRFLQRIWRLVDRHAGGLPAAGSPEGPLPAAAAELRRRVHQTIDKVTRDVEQRIQLNTAVAALMELANDVHRLEVAVVATPEGKPVLREALEALVRLLGPFTPHVGEEMWAKLGHADLARTPWPAFDPAAAREEEVELAVQVNGKVRGRVVVPRGATEDAIREKALAEPRVAEHLQGKAIAKCVVVPGRLVSVVAK
jgi:leucyl-tRNA synthetase